MEKKGKEGKCKGESPPPIEGIDDPSGMGDYL